MIDKKKLTDKIAKIIFKSGMLDSMDKKSSCEECILTADEIPPNIQQMFSSDKVSELSGTWGDPDYGSPIQYQWAIVETENGKSYEYKVCNLAIMIFHSEDEKIKRLFRFLVRVERYVKDCGKSIPS
ncbi:MAG: hypothetical protein U9Q24_01610 [Candidatus Ratteibacteria bacterium]|nr:hypothetical protein [Candidatus Ratteibacteria bacterium]